MTEPTCRFHGPLNLTEQGWLNGVEVRYYDCPAVACSRTERIEVTAHEEPPLLPEEGS